MRRGERAFAVLLLSVLLVPAGPLFASSLEDFRRAVEALQNGAWRDAQLLAESAIADQRFAQPDVVSTEALGPIPYTPHLILGLALYEQGDCEAAERSLEFARAQGVAERTGSVLWPRGLRALTVCRSADLLAARQKFRAAEQAALQTLIEWRRLADGDLASEKLAERRDLVEGVRRAEARLRAASENAESGDASVGVIEESEQAALAVGEQLDAAVSDLERDIGVTLAGRVARTTAALDMVDAAIREMRESYPGSVRASEGRSFAELERTLRQARSRLERGATGTSAALEDAVRLAETARVSADEIRERLAELEERRSYDAERRSLTDRWRRVGRRRERLPAPLGDAEQQRLATVDRRLQQVARDIEQSSDIRGLAPARERLVEAEAAILELETAGDGGEIEEAAAAYLRGDYSRSLQLLHAAGRCQADSEGRRGLRTCVLEAASAFALIRSGGSTEEVSERLDELLTLIRRIDPAYRPSTSYFSPAFRALFEPSR